MRNCQSLKMREFSTRQFPHMRRIRVNIEARCCTVDFMNENCDVEENSLALENSLFTTETSRLQLCHIKQRENCELSSVGVKLFEDEVTFLKLCVL